MNSDISEFNSVRNVYYIVILLSFIGLFSMKRLFISAPSKGVPIAGKAYFDNNKLRVFFQPLREYYMNLIAFLFKVFIFF